MDPSWRRAAAQLQPRIYCCWQAVAPSTASAARAFPGTGGQMLFVFSRLKLESQCCGAHLCSVPSVCGLVRGATCSASCSCPRGGSTWTRFHLLVSHLQSPSDGQCHESWGWLLWDSPLREARWLGGTLLFSCPTCGLSHQSQLARESSAVGLQAPLGR